LPCSTLLSKRIDQPIGLPCGLIIGQRGLSIVYDVQCGDVRESSSFSHHDWILVLN
jgi:hypothetical protein